MTQSIDKGGNSLKLQDRPGFWHELWWRMVVEDVGGGCHWHPQCVLLVCRAAYYQ